MLTFAAMREPALSFVGNVPVRIYAPEGGAARAAVLFFHGLRSSGKVLEVEARAIAAAGVTAIVPDAPHHGARRDAILDAMPDTATREGYATLLRILREARDEVPALVDHALELGHEEVAIGGVSMGGYIALAAGTIEPRLVAVVSLLGSPDWSRTRGRPRRPPASSPRRSPSRRTSARRRLLRGRCSS